MISFEKQAVSLERAKRLKELGVRQESVFWWRASPGTAGYDNDPATSITWCVADLPFKLEWAEKQYDTYQIRICTMENFDVKISGA
jgi:hypothetical protein